MAVSGSPDSPSSYVIAPSSTEKLMKDATHLRTLRYALLIVVSRVQGTMRDGVATQQL